MTVRALLVAVVSAAALLPMAGTSGAPTEDTAAGCDWGREYHRTLTSLGESPSDWRVVDVEAKRPGVYAHALLDTDTVELGKDIPCRYLSSIIRHEWAHLQQGRMYGGHRAVLDAYEDPGGAVMEFAADCAAWRLGATYSPYLAQGTQACDEAWPRAEAQRIISFRSDG